MSNFSSTQAFTEINSIKDNTAFFKDGSAALIIEVSSTNFTLLSADEQSAKIFAYASFLNSLSFTIQIVINNKRVDISSYITLLNDEIEKIKDKKILDYMTKYRNFVEELVKQNTVLDKRFYLVIPHSYYESTNTSGSKKTDFNENIISSLKIKAESILNQFERLGLQTRILNDDEILKIFKFFYRPNLEESTDGNI